MNFKMMGRFIAQILAIEGVFMIPALHCGLQSHYGLLTAYVKVNRLIRENCQSTQS